MISAFFSLKRQKSEVFQTETALGVRLMPMLQTMRVVSILCIFVFFSAAAAIAANAKGNRIGNYKFYVNIICPENAEAPRTHLP